MRVFVCFGRDCVSFCLNVFVSGGGCECTHVCMCLRVCVCRYMYVRPCVRLSLGHKNTFVYVHVGVCRTGGYLQVHVWVWSCVAVKMYTHLTECMYTWKDGFV